ncbi:hypothetical protein [Photobacterium leiognathi]|uniref:hypothetical protein n=1 Tax=Photobacterium leiognathi TaxID=553611 RepID=UPI002980E5F8|nr:hypothetical protein [Photobacterium leiognathi]
MKIVSVGKNAKVGKLSIKRNIVVTNDVSSVVGVDIGENGEVVNLDAEGNEVMTPEAYTAKLKQERLPLLAELAIFKEQLNEIQNEISRARIKREVTKVEELSLQYDISSNDKLKNAVKVLKETCFNVGCGVIAGLITTL